MSDRPRAILACPTSLSEPQQGLAWLMSAPDNSGAVARFVATDAKFSPGHGVKTINLAAGYPAEHCLLLSHRHVAGGLAGLQPFIDGQALFGLRTFAGAHPEFAQVTLVRELAPGAHCTAPGDEHEPFRCVVAQGADDSGQATSVAIDFELQRPEIRQGMDLVWDMMISGTNYAVAPGCLCSLLNEATRMVSVAA